MKTNLTMVEKETNSNGFILVNNSNTNKKAHMDQEQYPMEKHEQKMAICINFYHPQKLVHHSV